MSFLWMLPFKFTSSVKASQAHMLWNMQSGEHRRTLRRDRPYERLNITGIQGLTQAQLASLRALGAVEDTAMDGP